VQDSVKGLSFTVTELTKNCKGLFQDFHKVIKRHGNCKKFKHILMRVLKQQPSKMSSPSKHGERGKARVVSNSGFSRKAGSSTRYPCKVVDLETTKIH